MSSLRLKPRPKKPPTEKENDGDSTFNMGKPATNQRRPLGAATNRPPPIKSMQRLTLVKPPGAKRASIAPRHPNLYTSGNLYYDEKWVSKQESGFSKWLNFVLTPEEEAVAGEAAVPGKVDVAKLWKACSAEVCVPRAPTKEVMSLRAYSVRRELNRLRRNACTLWTTPAITQVMGKVELEIESGRLKIRADKSIHKDVGMKKGFLELLLSFHPIWLRIGLETVFGEVLPFQGPDVIGMSRFVLTRVLVNPDIQAQYAHRSVAHLYKQGYDEATKAFTLKKFLQLVYFLDKAKEMKVLRHDPCLFCKDSSIKQSRDLLIAFSRDYLAGEGDVTKHLSYLGYTVTRKQTPLEEFDYAVTNLAVDLRDGVRLCRVMEFLTNETLRDQLRYPSVSRLQKIHNVEVALRALKFSPAGPAANIDSKNIVEGHLEKTLGLMWHIIFGFQLEKVLDANRLRKEIAFLEKSLRYRVQIKDSAAATGCDFINRCSRTELAGESGQLVAGDSQDSAWTQSPKVKLLLQWARLVCAHHALEIENLTVSFSDGRALCYILHHYYPSFLAVSDIRNETASTNPGANKKQQGQPAPPKPMYFTADDSNDDSFGNMTYCVSNGGQQQKSYEDLLNNEKANFKLFVQKCTDLGGVPMLIEASQMSNTIPDQKVTVTFLTCLASRLLDLSVEMTAARTIQLFWRRYNAKKREREMKIYNDAAKKIQRCFISYLHRVRVTRYTDSTIVIQRAFKKYLFRKTLTNEINLRAMLKEKTAAATTIQTWFRCCSERRAYLQTLYSVVIAQSCVRRYLARRELSILKAKRARENYAAVTIQKAAKGFMARRQFARTMKNIVMVQTSVRGFLLRLRTEKEEQNRAATIIQACFRGYVTRKDYHTTVSSIILLQSHIRLFFAKRTLAGLREEKKTQINAATCIQKHVRGHQIRKRYLYTLQSIILLQSYARVVIAKRELQCRKIQRQTENEAAVVIQSCFRGFVARKCYKQTLYHIVNLQCAIRCYLARSQLQRLRAQNAKEHSAATTIQRHVRGLIARNSYTDTLAKIVLLQGLVRCVIAKKELKALRAKHIEETEAATIIQTTVRTYLARKSYLDTRQNIICLQSHVRALIARRQLAALKMQFNLETASVTTIQRHVRGYQARKAYAQSVYRIILLQSHIRVFLARKEAAWLRRVRQERNEAANIIQKTIRGFQARKKYLQTYAKIVIVQSCVRRFLARVELQCLRAQHQLEMESATMIQKTYKGYMAKKSYKQIVSKMINLQCAFRCYLAKKKLAQLKAQNATEHAAATLIQKVYRGYRARLSFAEDVHQIVIVQNLVRCFLAKKKLAALKAQWQLEHTSAIIIQKTVKGYLARRSYTKTVEHVINLQCATRCYLARKELALLKTQYAAATKIQKIFRGYQARQKFSRDVEHVVLAQSCVRRFLAKRTLASLKAQWKLEHESAIIIQNTVKGYLARRSYSKTVDHIINLQCATRCYLARKELALLKTRHAAAATIQKYFRGYQARQRFCRDVEHIILAQSCVRKFLAKKMLAALKAQLQLEHESAIIIQKTVKGYLARRSYTKTVEHIINLQCATRCFLARKELALLKTQYAAATKIQKIFRGYQARQKFSRDVEHVVLAQSCVRRFLAKRVLEALRVQREKETNAAIMIQKHFRGQKERNVFLQTRSAIVLIQCCMRRFLAQKELQSLREQKAREVAAATLIQKCYRGYVCRQTFHKDVHHVIIVQNAVRGFLARRQLSALKKTYAERVEAATTIQKYLRTYLCKKAFQHRVEQIVLLQCNVRVFLAKKKLAALRKQRNLEIAAATTIQKNLRMFIAKRDYHALLKATVTLQTQLRGYLARQELCQRRAAFKRANEAATLIQKIVRGRIAKTNYTLARKNVIMVQASVRMFLAKKELTSLKKQWQLENEAATTIQMHFRGFSARVSYKTTLGHILTIQCAIRCFLAKRKLGQLQQQRSLENQAATTIQKHVRGRQARKIYLATLNKIVLLQCCTRRLLAQRKLRSLKDERDREEIAAVTLQKHFRGFIARREYSRSVKSVVQVQCCVRRFLAHKKLIRLRMQSVLELCAATIIQKNVRGLLARKQYAKSRQNVILIQSHIRVYLAKKEAERLRQERNRRTAAAIMVQKTVRGFIARKAYNQARELIVLLQSHIRKCLAQKQLVVLRKEAYLRQVSATLIQATYRGYMERKKYKQTLENIVMLQTRVRMLAAKTRLQELKEEQRRNVAAVIIQKNFKGLLQRRAYSCSLIKIITVQSCVRRFLAAKLLSNLRHQRESEIKSAIVIQSVWRMHVARKSYLLKQQSALIVQCCVRGFLARRTLTALKIQRVQEDAAAVTIQKHVRGFLARSSKRRALTVERSTLRLQSWSRMIVVRREFLRQRRAAVVVQKHFRGNRVRQAFRDAHQNSPTEEPIVVEDLVVTEELGKKIEEVRLRAKEAEANASEEDKLCNRASFALDILYNRKDMAQLIKVLKDLDVSTRFSYSCCDQLIADGPRCLFILLDLISRCNRSIPHMDLVSSGFDVLINLAKYAPAREIMYVNREKVAVTTADVMKMYRDKSAELFSKGCSVLWTVAHDEETMKFIKLKLGKRVGELHATLAKKHQKEMAERRRQNSFSMTKKTSKSSLVRKPKTLSMEPAWKIRQSHVRFYSDPYVAISSLVKKLGLKVEKH